MPTTKAPQLNPSGLMKHLWTRSVGIPHHIFKTRMESWDFIKLLALYLSVHMELSIRLSFYLIRSLGGYIVGTTMRFPVEIVEALAPQSHR
jgi:hypothetical protein